MGPLELSLLCAALANIGVGFYVLVRGPRRVSTYAFFLTAIGIGGWVGNFALLLLTHNFFFDKPMHYAGTMFVFGFFLLAQTFPRGEPWQGWKLIVYLPFIIAVFYIIPAGGVVAYTYFAGNIAVPTQGSLFPIFATGVALYLLFGTYLLVRTYYFSSKKERVPFLYFFLGLGMFTLAFLVGDILLPSFGFPYANVIGPFASILFIGCTAYTLIRHELLDIRIVIQRGLIYSVLLGSSIALYLTVLSGVNVLFGANLNGGAFLSAILTSIVAVIGAPLLETKFKKITDSVFFKDHYDYPQALESLSRTLHEHMGLSDLISAAERELVRSIRAKDARILLFTSEEHRSPVFIHGLSVPLVLNQEVIGSIELDEKRSGDLYTLEDQRLLSTFAYQAATALSRARLYEEVQLHAAKLEKKVVERTAEIEQLRNRERQMMIDLSHGLQTPLAVLSAKLESVETFIIHDSERQSLMQSVTEVSGFVYDLLTLTNLERSITTEEQDHFSLTDLVREAADEIRIITSGTNTKVETFISDNIEFKGSARHVREALINLLNNAVKYAHPQKQNVVRLSLTKETDTIRLFVADTGIGIAPEDIPHIFDRFYRAKSQVYGNVRGSGLGLAITKAIVEHEGGSITAESTLGKGSIFTITLHD